MSADLPTHDYLNELVDTDPLKLRDEAYALLARVENAEQRQRLADSLADRLEATIGRAQEANRRLRAALIASAHLLDVPYTNAPDLTPWTRSIKPAMHVLKAALDSAPTTEQTGGD